MHSARAQRRGKWIPTLLGMEKYAGFNETIRQKLNEVQKAAWAIYLKASNDSAKVGALRTVLEALNIDRDIFQTQSIMDRLDKLEEIAPK